MRATDSDPRLAAVNLRLSILDMVETALSGHIDSSFSCVEIIVALYKDIMRYDVSNPLMPERDRFILAKGHAAPALYGILSEVGYFDKQELATLRKLGSRLQGHPKVGLPGVEVSTGSLGQGLSVAAGAALALKRVYGNGGPRVFALMGDGEIDEGQVWEAVMFAGYQKISNLVAIVDGNKLQYTGAVGGVVTPADLSRAVRSFGWDYIEIDGHDHNSILTALQSAGHTARVPLFVYAHTIKGKDGLFMEDNLAWHGKVPSTSEIQRIRDSLVEKKRMIEVAKNA